MWRGRLAGGAVALVILALGAYNATQPLEHEHRPAQPLAPVPERSVPTAAAALAAARHARCASASGAVPRIYAYADLPRALVWPPLAWRDAHAIQRALLASRHATSDGACADFYLMPAKEKMRQREFGALVQHIAQRWPYWNESLASGVARHLLFLPGDHGPGDTVFSKQPADRIRRQLRRELWPENARRPLIFVTITGDAQRACVGCVQPLDIRLPSPHPHICGVLCGYSAAALEAFSPWAPAHRGGPRGLASLSRRRPFRLFWAGKALHAVRIRLVLAQGDANLSHSARNRIVDTSGGARLPPRLRSSGAVARVDYAQAMCAVRRACFLSLCRGAAPAASDCPLKRAPRPLPTAPGARAVPATRVPAAPAGPRRTSASRRPASTAATRTATCPPSSSAACPSSPRRPSCARLKTWGRGRRGAAAAARTGGGARAGGCAPPSGSGGGGCGRGAGLLLRARRAEAARRGRRRRWATRRRSRRGRRAARTWRGREWRVRTRGSSGTGTSSPSRSTRASCRACTRFWTSTRTRTSSPCAPD